MISERIYKADEIGELLNDSRKFFLDKAWGKYDPETKSRIEYYNFPVAFDIETTNLIQKESDETEKQIAFMYVWQMSFCGLVIMGRTWEEWKTVMDTIQKRLLLDETHRLVIYIHNLGFEFSFIHKYLDIKRVFAISSRSPIVAETNDGFEFRCSAKLSGLSLESVAENLTSTTITKLVGSLDYDLIRHSETPLSEKEIEYCIHDVKILHYYILEEMKRNGNSIAKIPMTVTGYARRHCREMCLNPPDENGKQAREGSITNRRYRKLMKELTIGVEEYDMLKRAFQGGFTHANAIYYNDVCKDVASYDFTSSYPAIMVMETFPMSRGEFVTVSSMEQLRDLMKYYHVIFDVEFTELKRRGDIFDTYLSRPRARYLVRGKKYREDNRKIVYCDKVAYTVTELDFQLIERCYKWKSMKIGACIKYRRDYLPTELVKAILELYRKKTELKNAWKNEPEERARLILELYMKYKGLLNSVYGMCVTDILRDLYEYDTVKKEWKEVSAPDKVEAIEKENKRTRRFLFYPWGVYVTAYARRNLWTAIHELGIDYIYSDTDSVKCFHHEAHADYFRKYNENVDIKIENAAKHHGLSIEDFSAVTVKGERKTIGYWDYEGVYEKFKTLGSKRYLTMKHDEDGYTYELTCSGLDKTLAGPYLMFHKYTDKSGQRVPLDIWKAFSDGVYIEPSATGKLTHTYLDDEFSGTVTDYLGNTADYHEMSGTHLSGCDYTLSVEDDYLTTIEYIIGLTRRP